VPAVEAIPLPSWLSAVDAAAMCVQGLTAHYLSNSLRAMAPGDTALVWAAAGGVGRFVTQLLAAKGVRVIAAVSSETKAKAALVGGAERAMLFSDVKTTVDELTDGTGVDVVFDGVGASTFDTSLGSVRPRGMLVCYGGSGGMLPPIDPTRLMIAGSVHFVRPRFADFVASRAELLQRTNELFGSIERGDLAIRVEEKYRLADIADAHRALESRTTVGKIVVLPP
jgi:NADPH:quinone reductase